MKRIALAFGAALVLALPGSTLAFHHGGLPSTQCAADAAGSPSNDNGMAKEAILKKIHRKTDVHADDVLFTDVTVQ